jgi:hypothetical protein
MATLSRKSASLLVGLALFCVLGVVGVVLAVTREGGGEAADCLVEAQPREATAQFVSRESLLPIGSEGDRRRAVVTTLEGAGPIGDVSAGRFYENRAEVPSLVPYGDRLSLVTALQGRPATIATIDLGEEVPSTDWSVGLVSDEPWSGFTGGAVGADWVAVFSGTQAATVTLAPDGERVSCVALPVEGGGTDVVAVTDQAGGEVVVLASGGTGDSWLGRLDPRSGEVLSSRRDPGADAGQRQWEDVKVAADLVVGSRWRPGTLGSSGLPRPDDAQAPWIVAWDLDGSTRWQYPDASQRPFPAVLLDLAPDGTAYVVSFDRGGPWLDAVDDDGQRAWRRPLRAGEWSGSLWDDVVVLRSPDPAGGPMLRALDARDGRQRWVARARQAPAVGEAPRSGYGEPLTTDEVWWVPAPNGLLRIDRRSGDVERLDLEARVDEMVRVGDALVVRSGEAVLVTR